jgi:hypothetical protein
MGKGEVYTVFYLRERDNFGDPDMDVKIELQVFVSGEYGQDQGGSR